MVRVNEKEGRHTLTYTVYLSSFVSSRQSTLSVSLSLFGKISFSLSLSLWKDFFLSCLSHFSLHKFPFHQLQSTSCYCCHHFCHELLPNFFLENFPLTPSSLTFFQFSSFSLLTSPIFTIFPSRQIFYNKVGVIRELEKVHLFSKSGILP